MNNSILFIKIQLNELTNRINRAIKVMDSTNLKWIDKDKHFPFNEKLYNKIIKLNDLNINN